MPAREPEPVATWRAIYQVPMPGEVVRGWLLVERLIEALDRDVQASGAQLLVAIMPGREEVESALSPLHEPRRAAAANWDIGQGNRVARSILDRLAIEYIDLSPALRRHAEATESSGFYAVDVHLAPDGHRVVASELADWLAPMLTELRSKNRAH
jgi:lysophospholipase L1-like esterase